MQSPSKEYIFEKMPIPKAVAKLAVPTIMSMLVTIAYNLADIFFVGQLNDSVQVAAVTISMPVFMVLMAIGNIFGIGSASYISRLLGVKEYTSVKQTSSFSFYTCLIVGLLTMAAGIPTLDYIVRLIGANDASFSYAYDYLLIILIGAPFIMLSFSLSQIIRAQGAAKESMIGMMIGTVLNIVLDPIMILNMGMGVTGAALASIISNAVSVLYYIFYLIKKSEFLSISLKYYKLSANMISNILKIGAPASLTNLLMSISSILLNNYAVLYGNNVVAALGIVNRIHMLPALVLMGLAQGVAPIVGYNYSAGNMKRMQGTVKFTAITALILGSLLTLMLFFAGEYAIQLFIDDSSVIKLGATFLRIMISSVPFLSVLFLLNSTFQAFGKGIPSLLLSVSRQGFVFIPLLILGNRFFEMYGIVFAQPIADIFSAVMSVIMGITIFKKESAKYNEAAQKDT
ncbi:MAG: MATE family efflux transporter [Oscillospiraceae bacterium]|jgi:putative MATE family efflux protein|nr:MATE family efflux transporter [Oscillospiraceae bacterium]